MLNIYLEYALEIYYIYKNRNILNHKLTKISNKYY